MGTEQVKVPDIGGADEVEVIEVLVAAGDEVVPEQSLIVLESDKASMEIPSPGAGRIVEVKVAVGDKVSEGHDILVLESERSAPTTQADVLDATQPEEPDQPEEQAGDEPAAASPGPAGTGGVQTVNVPDIGGAEGVTVIEVCVREGDDLAAEDPIVVLESDKASMEIPSPAAGRVERVIVHLDAKVSEGDPLIELAVAGTGQRAGAAPAPARAPKTDPAPGPAEMTDRPPVPSKPASYSPGASVHAGPAVRRLAREFGVDLARVPGSGRKGRVLKEDIQQYVRDMLARGGGDPGSAGTSLPEMPEVDFSKFGPVEEVELSKINKLSAKNLHRSWLHVPHVTQFDDADITELENFRKAHNGQIPDHGVKLTLLPFIVKACAGALAQHPRFNTSLHPSGEKLIQKQYCHIGIAVDTPGGLVVPVIRDVPGKGIYDLARECGELAEKARNKRLSPADMQGACFSISSLGGIGGTAFTPIVNAPEVAILGVSKSGFQPVYNGSGFEPRLMLPLCLSYDHRVIDGALAARFVTTLSRLLGDIRHLLL